jgi:hypothetical protein
MFHRVLFLALFLPSPAYGQNKPETARRDLVAAIRKKLALDTDAHKAIMKDLDATLVSAKKGLVNSSDDANITPPKTPGTDPYAFKSEKAKADFVKQVEAELKRRETIHDDAAKDLKKVIGFMGMPKMEAVGHLKDSKTTVTVHKVLDRRTVTLNFNYPELEVENNSVGNRIVPGPLKMPKPVIKTEQFVLSEYDTTRMVEGKPVELDLVLYVGDSATNEFAERMIRAVPVVLTDAEKKLVREK